MGQGKIDMNKYFGVKDKNCEKVFLGSLLICPTYRPSVQGYGPYKVYWDAWSSSYRIKNIHNKDNYPILTCQNRDGDIVLAHDFLVFKKDTE